MNRGVQNGLLGVMDVWTLNNDMFERVHKGSER